MLYSDHIAHFITNV